MGIFQILLVGFLLVPLVEIYLLIKVGSLIGALPTVFLVVFTAVLGAWLLRLQGFATLGRVRQTLARGELPAIELLEGVVLVISGALLLTPGFFTDTLGFLGLIPAVRRTVILWFLRRGLAGSVRTHHAESKRYTESGPRTIEGEYRREDD